VRVNSARRGEPDHLREERLILTQEVNRQAPGLHDFLAMIEILQEGVNRPHPLLDPARQLAPFARRDDPGDHVERNQPLFGGIFPIDVEGDADATKEMLSLSVLTAQPVYVLSVVPLAKVGVSRADRAVLVEHLIVA
jgi:hypothetical protein